jgi:DNA-binding PadR family transcriptional regulator
MRKGRARFRLTGYKVSVGGSSLPIQKILVALRYIVRYIYNISCAISFKRAEKRISTSMRFTEDSHTDEPRGERRGHGQRGREHGRHGHGFPHRGRGEHGFGSLGRGGFDRFAGRGWGRLERGFGRRERLFDAGDLKIVILKLLSEQPSYGYQLMKTMEERLAGGYTPSAGVIYPTLTMLEEEGLAAASVENNKKVYAVTDEGREYLQAHASRAQELFERIDFAGKHFERERAPELMRAFEDLGHAVRAKCSRNNVTAKSLGEIAEVIHSAAKAIDKL